MPKGTEAGAKDGGQQGTQTHKRSYSARRPEPITLLAPAEDLLLLNPADGEDAPDAVVTLPQLVQMVMRQRR